MVRVINDLSFYILILENLEKTVKQLRFIQFLEFEKTKKRSLLFNFFRLIDLTKTNWKDH